MTRRLTFLFLCALITAPLLFAQSFSGGQAIRNLARAWFLAPFESDTISPSQSGMGWADGKFTLQTPGGALQMYMDGEPEEGQIYWPGRVTADVIEAAEIVGEMSAAQITSGTLPTLVMWDSLTQPAANWSDLPGRAGANGLTYGTTGPLGATEPSTPGMYAAMIEVTDGGVDEINRLEGRIRSLAELRVLLGVPARVVLPADVTNDNATANTLQNVTGLVLAVPSAGNYAFKVFVDYTSAATTTGSRWTVTGPAASRITYNSRYTLTATNQTQNEGLSAYELPANANTTSLVAANVAIIEGTASFTAAGNLQVRFASEISASAITAKAGTSYMELVRLP